jgi:hypothetical protein
VLLCLSVMLDSLLCLSTSISFCTRWYNVIWRGTIHKAVEFTWKCLFWNVFPLFYACNGWIDHSRKTIQT